MTTSNDTRTSSVELKVWGMTCGSCQRHVRDALAAVPGATDVTVSLRQRSATVHWASGVPDVDALLQAVRRAGYDASVSVLSGAATARVADARAGSGCCCEGHR